MAKEIEIRLTREQAERFADIIMETEEVRTREEVIEDAMKPRKALFG